MKKKPCPPHRWILHKNRGVCVCKKCLAERMMNPAERLRAKRIVKRNIKEMVKKVKEVYRKAAELPYVDAMTKVVPGSFESTHK